LQQFASVETTNNNTTKAKGGEAVVDGQWIEISYYLVHLVTGEAFI
jgi:hypothetical protein